MSDEGGNAKEQVKERSNMKRTMFFGLLLVGLAGLTGCATQHGRHPLMSHFGRGCAQATEGSESNNGCPSERQRCCRLCNGAGCKACNEEQAAGGDGGAATGAVTYPYYTTRGPRDFYAKNPRSIGP